MPEVPVKVFIRIRPLLAKELLESNQECLQVLDSQQLVLGQNRPFRFDRIFAQDSSQSQVYRDSVGLLVGRCLDGYNVTVLAYGQTGSGKSYTMGSENSVAAFSTDSRGIIPRALEEIFESVRSKKAGLEYRISVSYMEIYKEVLRDLLWTDVGVGVHEMHIREDEQGSTVVVGCSELAVESCEEALGWLGCGNSARITGATQMNLRSSRSHAIFTIHVNGRRRDVSDICLVEGGSDDGEAVAATAVSTVSSQFHFVDLAGSERASKTGNKGERFKESVHINSGLLALGNVISALGDGGRRGKSQHVPYRDSKITRLLKDSLGGNSETVLITCLNPSARSFAENLNSLKYAQRARNIQNKPVVNINFKQDKLQQMKNEIVLLREELAVARQEASKMAASAKSSGSEIEGSPASSDKPSETGGWKHQEVGRVYESGSANEDVLRQLSRASAALGVYSRCFRTVREMLVTALTRQPAIVSGEFQVRGRSKDKKEETDEEKRRDNESLLSDCLKILEGCGGEELGDEITASLDRRCSGSGGSPLRDEAVILRSELEKCEQNLRRDRLAFVVKMEELEELQYVCESLSEQKERAEAMWMASQNNEALLVHQLQVLERKMAALEDDRIRRDAADDRSSFLTEVDDIARLTAGFADENEVGGADYGTAGQASGDVDITMVTREVFEAASDKGGDSEGTLSEDSLEKDADRAGSKAGAVGSDGSQSSSPADLKNKEQQTFEATRSLLHGKVRASSLEDFTEESLLSSLRTLTRCIVSHRDSSLPPSRSQQKLVFPATAEGPDEENSRTDTLAASSLHEPAVSGRLSGSRQSDVIPSAGFKSEMALLSESTVDFQERLVQTEDELCHAQEELRCLTIKIRLKEQLIQELGKNGRLVKKQNATYAKRIYELEEEAAGVQDELHQVQSALLQSRGSGMGVAEDREEEDEKMEGKLNGGTGEHKKKLVQAQRRLAALRKKQEETKHLASYGLRSERRIEELETGVERLRNHQESLRRKLRREADKKLRLEVELQKYQHRIKTLQTRSEQQTKVLKVKTEEAAAAQRKLRLLSNRRQREAAPDSNSASHFQLTEKMAWLEDELNIMCKEKQAVSALEKELEEREEILKEREKLVAERNDLDTKRLESSRAVSRQLQTVSVELSTVESSLRLNYSRSSREKGGASPIKKGGARVKDSLQSSKGELEKLIRERERLVKDHQTLKTKLENEGALLSQDEQNMLLVLNEQVEMLDAAIEFKNHSIALRSTVMKKDGSVSARAHADLLVKDKLGLLSRDDLCHLFEHWFGKVLALRLQGEASECDLKALGVELKEERERRRKVELALHQARLDTDRQFTAQQLEHHREIEFLLQRSFPDDQEDLVSLKKTTETLEEELRHYKHTCRSLWKKLQQVSRGSKMKSLQHGGSLERKELSGSMPELTMANSETSVGCIKREGLVESLEGEDRNLKKREIERKQQRKPTKEAKMVQKKEPVALHRDGGVVTDSLKRVEISKGGVKENDKIGQDVKKKSRNKKAVEEVGYAGAAGMTKSKVGHRTGGMEAPPPKKQPVVVKKSRSELRLLSAEDLAKRS